MSIAKRLYLLMAASLASLLIVTAAGIIQINKVFSAANYGNVNTIPSLIDLNDAMNNSALTRLRVWQFMAVDDAATRDKIIAMMAENDKAVDNAISHYEKENLSDDTDKQLIADRSEERR
uniref:MCP four helix bundle domain-containing protein n=1 Tax=Undibacterium luofuense TaxID=2828733 RepID=UPI0030ED49C1